MSSVLGKSQYDEYIFDARDVMTSKSHPYVEKQQNSRSTVLRNIDDARYKTLKNKQARTPEEEAELEALTSKIFNQSMEVFLEETPAISPQTSRPVQQSSFVSSAVPQQSSSDVLVVDLKKMRSNEKYLKYINGTIQKELLSIQEAKLLESAEDDNIEEPLLLELSKLLLKRKKYQKDIDSYLEEDKKEKPSSREARGVSKLDPSVVNLPKASEIQEIRNSPPLAIPTDLTKIPVRKPGGS